MNLIYTVFTLSINKLLNIHIKLDNKNLIMSKKICFVVMGFGKKKDPETNRTIDLDATYQSIIKPAVESSGLECVRADEITETGLIDRSMYALLYRADIVIADISTYNPNAIYELGVRHTLKKRSTIIIKEGEGYFPFDFNHNRILCYKHLGNEITLEEAERCKKELVKLITIILEEPKIDSPLYTYIPNAKEPSISDDDLNEIIGEHKTKENTIFILTNTAKQYMADSKFIEAAQVWKKLSLTIVNDNYYIQQQALCTYKSQSPSKLAALTDALTIIKQVEKYNDTETLGILGSINKRLWKETNDDSYLNRALECYGKGWNIHKDYYTGENYATCMLEKANFEIEDEEKIYYKIGAKKVYSEIIKIVSSLIEREDSDDMKWKYATLSNSYLACGDVTNAVIYEKKFLEQNPEKWEVETFNETKNKLKNIFGCFQ